MTPSTVGWAILMVIGVGVAGASVFAGLITILSFLDAWLEPRVDRWRAVSAERYARRLAREPLSALVCPRCGGAAGEAGAGTLAPPRRTPA
jgi:hypothetical protein